MPNLIDLRGSGPVAIPDDLLGPLGFMSGALYKVLPSDWNWAAYVGAFNAIADARDALRAKAHQRDIEFNDLLWREAERQKRVAYIPRECLTDGSDCGSNLCPEAQS